MIPLVLCFFAPFAFDQFTLSKIALAAVLVLVVGWNQGFIKKHLTSSLLLLFAVFCASAIFSGDFLVNLTGRYCARWLGLIPLAVCLLAYHLPPIDNLNHQMRVSAFILSIHAISQLFWNPWGYEVLSAGHRVSGAIGSPPTLGCVLAMCLPFCYGRTPARALLSGLTMMALLVTGSRGPLLGAVVGALIVGWASRSDTMGAKSSAGALTSGLLVLCLAAIFLDHGRSDKIRWLTWTSSLEVWKAHPWLGCGAETYVDTWRAFRTPAWVALSGPNNFQDHAHNDFLEILAVSGLLGLGAYCLFLRRLWGQIKAQMPPKEIRGALAALFVCAKFNAVPFPAIFVGALLLGYIDPPTKAAACPHGGCSFCGWPARWPAVLACVFAVWGVWAVAADTVFYQARRVLDFPGIMRAVAMNPLELSYGAHEADLLTRKWDADGQKSPDLLYGALDISWRSLHLHPGSVQARHMVTQNLLLLAKTDPRFIEPAQKSVAALYALDPQLNFKFKVVVK